ncbi:MAG: glycoside hydrolase family 127 protein [Fibrobacterota bacterium]|nr:MAG: glycoside hydrolase family 127 protein [Fibrobacterota bacterium]
MKKTIVFLLGLGLLAGCEVLAQDKLYPSMFPLGDVKLLDGPFKQRMDLNGKTLLAYDVDRLMQPYLKEAGLTAKGAAFPNWAGLDGHVGGHYLSALAMHYAATKDAQIKTRMDYVVSELKRAQDQNGKDANFVGYLSGVPNGKAMWLKFKGGDAGAQNGYWVPWYNIHKTYAGLRDAWVYAGDETSKAMFLKLCDWGITITNGLTDAKMESMMGTEYGGMNEVYADAYSMTKDVKYLNAAKKWSHKWLLNAMSANSDNLDNKHANTQVPKAVGFARIAELSNDATYTKGAQFFWTTVTGKRSIAIGANSRQEYFPDASKYTDYVNVPEGPESCNSYNMLKLTEDLFRISPQAKYADFYERSLFNHVLSMIHPSHGGYVYFTPARPRHYRNYSKVNSAMWCCVGSGMENPAKYAQFAYMHKNDSLFVNLFMATELNWKEKGVKIAQTTAFPEEEKTKFTITAAAPAKFRLLIRHPSWVRANEMKVVVGSDTVSSQSPVSSYVEVNRTWNNGDVVTVLLPMRNSVEQLPNVANYYAILHGPIVLGAKTGTESLNGLVADDGRWSHIAGGTQLDLTQAPMLAAKPDSIASRLVPVAGKPLTFKAPFLFSAKKDTSLVFEPFYKIHDARYMMYWMLMTDQKTLDSLSKAQAAALLLEGRTVDRLTPGQQQPEVDHKMVQTNTTASVNQGESLRSGGSCTGGTGASVTYELSTNGEADLSLWVRYWGNETTCSRTFDILVDGQKVATETLESKWKVNEFKNVEYTLPNSLVAGKSIVTVKFQATSGMVGGLYGVRLLRKTPLTGIVTKSTSLDGLPFVQLIRKAGSLGLELAPAEVATTVQIRRSNGRLVKSKTIAAGIQHDEVDLKGVHGPLVVQIVRSGALIQASLVSIPE